MDFLEKIIEYKKQEVSRAKENMSENILLGKAREYKKERFFFKTLKEKNPNNSYGINIIAEIKRASPSKGIICADLDPVILAKTYESSGAAAISVLTERKWFHGSFKDFTLARNATQLPVIRKDFIISSYQIYQSLTLGVDAILLIVRALSAQQLKDYLDICKEFNLDALIEIHSKEELETAILAKANLIGINSRNLNSFETNIENTKKIMSFIKENQGFQDKINEIIFVAESGIKNHQDIMNLYEIGIWNFLIGESLVKSQNKNAFLNNLLTGK